MLRLLEVISKNWLLSTFDGNCLILYLLIYPGNPVEYLLYREKYHRAFRAITPKLKLKIYNIFTRVEYKK